MMTTSSRSARSQRVVRVRWAVSGCRGVGHGEQLLRLGHQQVRHDDVEGALLPLLPERQRGALVRGVLHLRSPLVLLPPASHSVQADPCNTQTGVRTTAGLRRLVD